MTHSMLSHYSYPTPHGPITICVSERGVRAGASARGFCIWSGNARELNVATLELTSNASFSPRAVSQSQRVQPR